MDVEQIKPVGAPVESATTATDIELVKQAIAGHVEAFELIMRRYNQRLYRIAKSILCEEHEAMDVVQETYVKAYYQLHQFRGPDGFASWLSRIAKNEAMMRIRKSRFLDFIEDDPVSTLNKLESSELEPLDDLANRQLGQLIEQAIAQLPVEYRSVYVMRAIQQLSTRETADSLNISEDSVKTRYLRAKRSLQQIFETHLNNANLDVYEFAGQRCDAIVQAVLVRLNAT
jgi:RNA polymerase sigma-70 factor (ECF subfamily)